MLFEVHVMYLNTKNAEKLHSHKYNQLERNLVEKQ